MKFYVVAMDMRTHEEWGEGSFDNLTDACDHARYCWGMLTKHDQREQQIEVRQYAGDIDDEDAPDSAFDYDTFDWAEGKEN